MKPLKHLLFTIIGILCGHSLLAQIINQNGELEPCLGLANVRDFSGSSEPYIGYLDGGGTTGFISANGTVYVGWNSYYHSGIFPQPNQDRIDCLLGQYIGVPGVTYINRQWNTVTAYPARNVLYYAPGQTFKAIQRSGELFFILSDQGKIYNWGRSTYNDGVRLTELTGKDTTVAAGADCSVFGKLREIKHPNGLAWKAMKIYSTMAYAADANGDWWCWGSAPKNLFPSTSISLPAVNDPFLGTPFNTYIPRKMDRLTVQPLVPVSDDQSTLVGYGGVGNRVMPVSYIGADSAVYSFGYTVTQPNLWFSSTFLNKIDLPAGVKAMKIQRVDAAIHSSVLTTNGITSYDCVLGTDGKIYYFVDGKGPMRQLSSNNYFFVDFVLRDIGTLNTASGLPLTIDHYKPDFTAVERGRTRLVYAHINVNSYYYAEVDPTLGVDFKVEKIWGHYNRVLIKNSLNNNSYVLFGNTVGQVGGPSGPIRVQGLIERDDWDTYTKATAGPWGFQLSGSGTEPVTSTSIDGIASTAPHKLVNCYELSGNTSAPTTAAGTIDCSKTQIVAAPVAGTPNQHALVVTVNVTTAGAFSPLSVSGSGMSLANGVTSVTATTTGVQQFQIPIKYDGSALANNFQFTIGQAGSCTADLTLQSKKVVKNVYTLQNCTAITPGTLSK